MGKILNTAPLPKSPIKVFSRSFLLFCHFTAFSIKIVLSTGLMTHMSANGQLLLWPSLAQLRSLQRNTRDGDSIHNVSDSYYSWNDNLKLYFYSESTGTHFYLGNIS